MVGEACSYHYQVDKELFLAAEGMYTGQSVYCGKKAEISVGNVIPTWSRRWATAVAWLAALATTRL